MNTLDFLLLDIDNCLVVSNGYKKAYIDTTNYFLKLFGQTQLEVNVDVATFFEFKGLTAEWDMVPITICIFLNWYWSLKKNNIPYSSLKNLNNMPQLGTNVDFLNEIHKKTIEISKEIQDKLNPTIELYKNCKEKKQKSIFANIWEDPILEKILLNSLDASKSVFFSRLECCILGSTVYEDFFHMTAPGKMNSDLETYDLPIISRYYRKKINNESGKKIYTAITTARPNCMSSNLQPDDPHLYMNLPEAESALRLLRWIDGSVKMMGFGSLGWLEEKNNLPWGTYLKPHPVHSLAAVFYAYCDDPYRALASAGKIYQKLTENKEIDKEIKIIPDNYLIRIGVFEDSTSGIKSARDCASILRKIGYDIHLFSYGVKTTSEKTAALEAENIEIFPDINAALKKHFSRIN